MSRPSLSNLPFSPPPPLLSLLVNSSTLIKIIKVDFGLTIDIEELINKVDTNGSGEIEYSEFARLLS